MKRLLSIGLSLFTTIGVMAQSPTLAPKSELAKEENAVKQVNPGSESDGSYFADENQSASREIATEPFSESYNIENLINQALPSQSNRAFTPIHRDSSLLEFTNSFGGVFFHSVGMVFNPGEDLIDRLSSDLPTLQYINSYNLDSVSFPYWYNRPVDSLAITDTTFIDTTAVDFRVEGDNKDSFRYRFDTAFRYTNTDTNVIETRVTFFNDNQNPLTVTKDTMLYPAYNLYDTFPNSNQVDTQMLMPDSTLKNNPRQVQLIDNITTSKQEVVDTLVVQYYIVRQNYISWGETQEGPFTGDTIRAASAPANVTQAEMSNPDGEVRIPLTTDDEFNTNNNDASTDITLDANMEVPAASRQLGEPLSVAATASFKPGYPIDGRDTLRTIDQSDNIVYQNNYITTIQNVFSGLIPNESWTNALTILNGQRYEDPQLADFFQDNFYMLNAPPSEAPGPNNNASTARYFPFTFHISADESDNIDTVVDDPGDTTSGIGLTPNGAQGVEVEVYPNPASSGDQVQVQLNSQENTEVDVQLYNTIGKKVQNFGTYQLSNTDNTAIQIDSRDLQPGIYFLNIRSDEGEVTRKLSITK